MQSFENSRGYRISDTEGMRNAWANRTNVATATSSRNGRLSVNGRTAGGNTWTFTNRDMDGNLISQSGRKTTSSRRQRDYDVRSGMNNISPRVIQAWLDNGLARVVDGNMVGEGGQVIRQRADGTYSMGLSVG